VIKIYINANSLEKIEVLMNEMKVDIECQFFIFSLIFNEHKTLKKDMKDGKLSNSETDFIRRICRKRGMSNEYINDNYSY